MLFSVKKIRNASFFICFLVGFFVGIRGLQAEDFSANSFKARDPVLYSAAYSTSTSFQLFSTMGQMAIGTSTAASYNVSAGFLTFPIVNTPIIVATAGTNQVALSWTAAVGYLGWNVSGYKVGQSTANGGPYSFTAAATTAISSTIGSLTAGTTYYFVVRALDAFGNSIATSSQVFGTPTAPVTPPATPSSGGGGGGGYVPPAVVTGALFSGRAYPKLTVTLLKDAQVTATAIAGADASFEISLTGLTAGNYIFSVYSEDTKGRRSSLLTFPVGITSGATTNVSGIFIAPTITTDKETVKRGDNVTILGQSAPQADIVISVNSDEEYFAKTISDKSGLYAYNFDTSPLEAGEHYTKSKALIGNMLASGYSSAINFKVGAKTVEREELPKKIQVKADLNNDGKVNLVDFSILSYWYKRPLTEKAQATVDLNGDKKVDLKDFSIMAYYWTG